MGPCSRFLTMVCFMSWLPSPRVASSVPMWPSLMSGYLLARVETSRHNFCKGDSRVTVLTCMFAESRGQLLE